MTEPLLFKTATYNAAYFEDAKVGAPGDYILLFDKADIVGFQEAGRNIDKQQIKNVAARKGFGVYFDPNESGCPIAWNQAVFELLDAGSVFLSPRTFVGSEGAGPSTMGEKHHVWVKLRHKESGRIVYFGTDHLTPSIYIAKRRKLHAQQTAGISGWIQSVKNLVITVGDYNIDAAKDKRTKEVDMPYAAFKRIGVVSTYETLGLTASGTLGSRHIDYVWYRLAPGKLEPVSHRIISKGLSSDHDALVVTFSITLTRRKRLAGRLRSLLTRRS